MSDFPIIHIARHGETAWSVSGQHTGLTDLPLTPQGEKNAQALHRRLEGLKFVKIFTSPLQRAKRTAELAGFCAVAEIDPDLVEWNYGDYEGRTSAQIRAERPDWQLFRDGAPGGESTAEAIARANRVCDRLRRINGNALLFSSGHFIRVLAARWIGVDPPVHSDSFLLSTASLSALGYDRNLAQPVIRFWNDTHHLNEGK